MHQINKTGYYGEFGGSFIPEILMPAIQQLQHEFAHLKNDVAFNQELDRILTTYAGRPTPLTPAKRLSAYLKGPQIVLKREDLLHTGAHKLNNALGQCLLAQHLHKTRVIAETGAGQHGVATAAACAMLGLECVIYMGAVDCNRQAPNVARMKLMGAKVISVGHGSQTLKEAINEAMRDWSESFETTHYCLGSALGPHPYPEMVAHFQSVIGREAKQQCLEQYQCLPRAVIACVGGGSNAIGIFSAFINDDVQLIGVEAGGTDLKLGHHAARMQGGHLGVLHGCLTYVLQDAHGQIAATHSISAGLDYPAISPQHANLYTTQRAEYRNVSDQEALAGFKLLSQCEGIIPALESAHAIAYIMKEAHRFNHDDLVIINCSGRGDKDIPQLMTEGFI